MATFGLYDTVKVNSNGRVGVITDVDRECQVYVVTLCGELQPLGIANIDDDSKYVVDDECNVYVVSLRDETQPLPCKESQITLVKKGSEV